MNSDLSIREIAERCLLERSLYRFAVKFWKEVEPQDFVAGDFHSVLCDHLENCWGRPKQGGGFTPQKFKRLLINAPPRHSKSLFLSVFWPAWLWTTRPELKIIGGSYLEQLAIRDAVKMRRLIRSPLYQKYWGHRVQIRSEQDSKMRYDTVAGGFRQSCSSRSGVTGEGGDLIIWDDPHNVKEVESPAERGQAILCFTEEMPTRISNPKTSVFVVAGQRVHEEDLSQKLIDGGVYAHLCLPMRYRDNHPYPSTTGYEDPRTEEGELLWEEFWDEESTEALVKTLEASTGGAAAANAQLDQAPSPRGGQVFQTDWFRYYSFRGDYVLLPGNEENGIQPRQWLRNQLTYMISADTASTTNTSSDYTAVTVWAITPDNDKLLWDCYHEKVSEPEVVSEIARLYQQYRPFSLGIEWRGGIGVIQALQLQRIPVLPLKGAFWDKDKYSRSITAQTEYRNGFVYHPGHAPAWLRSVERELTSFTKEGTHAHDDLVDSVSSGMLMLRGQGMAANGTYGVITA